MRRIIQTLIKMKKLVVLKVRGKRKESLCFSLVCGLYTSRSVVVTAVGISADISARTAVEVCIVLLLR